MAHVDEFVSWVAEEVARRGSLTIPLWLIGRLDGAPDDAVSQQGWFAAAVVRDGRLMVVRTLDGSLQVVARPGWPGPGRAYDAAFPVWERTMELRWRPGGGLEQLWRTAGGNEDWRPVPEWRPEPVSPARMTVSRECLAGLWELARVGPPVGQRARDLLDALGVMR